jgi:hypothetical protein
MVNPNIDEIYSFMQMIGTEIQLCCIAAAGPCEGRWFGDDVSNAAEWALSQNKLEKNIYWTVNVAQAGCNRKPSKKDILAVRFAHVDIDPPKNGGPFNKITIAAELLAHSLPPSLVVDSGGGVQAFWPIIGDASIEQVELLNQNLAVLFGGDNCHNIDRLMRVAGTINYPNPKKLAAGRIAYMSKVIQNANRV